MTTWRGDARFLRALSITLEREGVFSNDQRDSGGETIYGIASAWHPEWFREVYALYAGGHLKDAANRARDFYYQEFWCLLMCPSIESELVALELFDAAVNTSPAEATRFLQSAVAMFLCAKGQQPITVDGRIGPRTLAAANSLARKYALQLVAAQNGFQFEYYHKLWLKDPEKWSAFIIGWMQRTIFERPKLLAAMSPPA